VTVEGRGGPTHEVLYVELLDRFLTSLDAASISYRLERVRAGSIAVMIAVPGQRWEVDFMASGEVEVEIFTSDGTILDESALPELIARFAD
jgi:hypothetical protein